MYQNVVVSPLFLKSFDSLDFEKASSLLANLSTEIFLCDKNKILLEEYDKLKEERNNDPQASLFLENFIKILTFGKAKLLNNVSIQKRNPSERNLYEYEKILASFDEWKIILTNNAEPNSRDALRSELNIELSDFENYYNPNEKSRIRATQIIKKVPGEEFDFRNWVGKFLRDTSYLEVQDGYVCSKNEFKDVEFIISSISRNAKVKVITLSDKARNESRHNNKNDGINVELKMSELKNKFSDKEIGYDLIDDKKMLEDRHIKTDKFFINLGHALGSTYKDKESGKILCKKQFTITISKVV